MLDVFAMYKTYYLTFFHFFCFKYFYNKKTVVKINIPDMLISFAKEGDECRYMTASNKLRINIIYLQIYNIWRRPKTWAGVEKKCWLCWSGNG